jgi:hypothetical protein
VKKLTKKDWVARGVHNNSEVAKLGGATIYLSYRTAETGRASQSAAWQVIDVNGKSDPNAHWRDYGNATFSLWNRTENQKRLDEAKKFATEKYGIKEWEKGGPYGDWFPEGTLAMAAHATEAFDPKNRMDVEIIVRGPIRCGKTTLSHMIDGLLKSKAFESQVIDRVKPGVVENEKVNDEALNHPYHVFGKRVKITIRTEQTQRTS